MIGSIYFILPLKGVTINQLWKISGQIKANR